MQHYKSITQNIFLKVCLENPIDDILQCKRSAILLNWEIILDLFPYKSNFKPTFLFLLT